MAKTVNDANPTIQGIPADTIGAAANLAALEAALHILAKDGSQADKARGMRDVAMKVARGTRLSQPEFQPA